MLLTKRVTLNVGDRETARTGRAGPDFGSTTDNDVLWPRYGTQKWPETHLLVRTEVSRLKEAGYLSRLIFFNRDVIKRLRFRVSIGLERELVVHFVIGIHVADVLVDDQVHVTKFINSTNVAVNHVASHALIHESALIFIILILISLKMASDCL
jgi:hypothetical protein